MTITEEPTTTPTGPRRVLGRTAMLVAVIPALRWLVCRYAVSPGQPPRTACDGCGAALVPGGPAGRALLPTGRCGQCRTVLGAPPFAVEIMALVVLAAAVMALPSTSMLLATLWWAACAIPLAFIDLRVHRLPDVLTSCAAAGVLAFVALDAAQRGQWDGLLRSAVCAAATGVIFLTVALVLGNRGLGLGDAKLIVSVAALMGWWGWQTVFAVVFLAFLAAGLVSGALLAAKRVDRHAHLPMGPFFIGATVLMLFLLAINPPA